MTDEKKPVPQRLFGYGKTAGLATNDVARKLHALRNEPEGPEGGRPEAGREVEIRCVCMEGLTPAGGWVAEATWKKT